MILEEIRKIDSSIKKIREFAWILTAAFLIWAGLLAWSGKIFNPFLVALALFFFAAGWVFPVFLRPLQRLWMILAVLLGAVMNRVILCILFYGVITPIALALRLTRKDILDMSFKDIKSSYWKPHEHNSSDPAFAERQF